jgi:ubiquinone biosynthesis protein UbiJ
MKELAYQTLEKIINQALNLDPEAKEQLAELADQTVALEITDWHLKLTLLLTNNGVRLLSDEPEEIDATISGPLLGIMQTACSGGDAATMRQTGLRMKGNIQLAEKLKHILSGLDIDWEEPLSRLLGPTIAGGMGEGVRRASSIAKSMLQSGVNQLSTFLKTDSGCLPSEAEITQFNRAVTVLRYDVDRLEARLNKLIVQSGDAS